jgi:DNA transformation protein
MVADAFVDHCLELLAPHGRVRARRMFGGHGLYIDDLFVAIIAFDRLYLKVDESSRDAFVAAGGEPFVYEGKSRPVTMSYCTPPAEALDSPALMAPWIRLALQAALAARAAKAPPRAARKSPRRAPR